MIEVSTHPLNEQQAAILLGILLEIILREHLDRFILIQCNCQRVEGACTSTLVAVDDAAGFLASITILSIDDLINLLEISHWHVN
jgi:hypothetical protein